MLQQTQNLFPLKFRFEEDYSLRLVLQYFPQIVPFQKSVTDNIFGIEMPT